MPETHEEDRRSVWREPNSTAERCGRMAGIAACCIATVALVYFALLYFLSGR
jgi:hypothetical protein